MIILSIPCLNIQFVKNSISKFPNYIYEFRLDLYNKYKKFPQNCINKNVIITLREDHKENYRKFPDKIKYYQKIVKKYSCLVDCEINLFSPTKLDQLKTENLILSYHDKNSFNLASIKKIIQKANQIPAKYLKLALNIRTYSNLLQISKLIDLSNKPVIFVALGKMGKLSRILYKHLGSIGTFIGMDNNLTAEGQLTTSEAELYRIKKISKQTKIGGIVGGKQVNYSLGLSFYNKYFSQNELDAVYLPFQVEDSADFKHWISSADINFYGFSITMPFKRTFSPKPINLFRPNNILLNTDKDAFEKARKYLNIKGKDKILILGSGGSSETALSVLTDHQVYLMGRNKKRINEMKVKYACKQAEPKIKYDVLINCTPLGIRGENFLKNTNLDLPKKIIDLPYTDSDTFLIKMCKEKGNSYVDGKMFWKWQAERQLEEFENYIKG